MNDAELLVGSDVNVDLSIGDGVSLDMHVDGGYKADLSVAVDSSANLEVADGAAANLEIGAELYPVGAPAYQGAYEATPTENTQVFRTSGKKMEHDFKVMPIPSNYGRISYSGSVITVW